MCKDFLITLRWGEPVRVQSLESVGRVLYKIGLCEESDTRQVRELDCVAGAFAFFWSIKI